MIELPSYSNFGSCRAASQVLSMFTIFFVVRRLHLEDVLDALPPSSPHSLVRAWRHVWRSLCLEGFGFAPTTDPPWERDLEG